MYYKSNWKTLSLISFNYQLNSFQVNIPIKKHFHLMTEQIANKMCVTNFRYLCYKYPCPEVETAYRWVVNILLLYLIKIIMARYTQHTVSQWKKPSYPKSSIFAVGLVFLFHFLIGPMQCYQAITIIILN